MSAAICASPTSAPLSEKPPGCVSSQEPATLLGVSFESPVDVGIWLRDYEGDWEGYILGEIPGSIPRFGLSVRYAVNQLIKHGAFSDLICEDCPEDRTQEVYTFALETTDRQHVVLGQTEGEELHPNIIPPPHPDW